MGITEWVALSSILLAILGSVIKGCMDKASLETKLGSIEKWKDKMELTDCLPTARCSEERKDCRENIYKDINRIERRFDDFIKVTETQNTKIGEVRENVIKILTLLESRKEN